MSGAGDVGIEIGAIEIRASVSPGEVRIAALRGGVLVDYALWRPGRPDGIGDVHRGRMGARVAALAGSFVEIEGATGFLPDSQGRAPEGTVLGVRVVRAAHGGKGPRLVAAEVPAGKPGLVARGPSPLAAMRARYPGAALVADDRTLIAGSGGTWVRRAFGDALEAEVASLAEPTMALPGGGRAHIAITPALTAIDVDLGGFASGNHVGGKAAAHLALNLAAMPALVRAIRLRNLGVAILVDFAGLPGKRRERLGAALAEALAAEAAGHGATGEGGASDGAGARLLGFSHLGFAEIHRPRIRPPLAEQLAGPHAAGLVALRAAAWEAAAAPERPLVLRGAPAILAALEMDPVALAQYRAMTGRDLALRAEPALGGWRIEHG